MILKGWVILCNSIFIQKYAKYYFKKKSILHFIILQKTGYFQVILFDSAEIFHINRCFEAVVRN